MKILLIVLGCLIIAMSLLLTLISPFGLIGVAIGVCIIIYGKKYKKPVQNTVQQEIRNQPDNFFPVAGVMFKNEDGSSRQNILKKVAKSENYSDSTAYLEKYFYDEAPAIRVSTEYGCVGNIRKSDVQTVLSLIEDSNYIARIDVEDFEDEDGKTIYRADVTITPLSAKT